MGVFPRQLCILLATGLCLGPWGIVQAALEPTEIAVLANSSFKGSVELAKYYCKVRNIPPSHIISLAMPDGERIARSLYEKSIAVQVREKLQQLEHSGNIR